MRSTSYESIPLWRPAARRACPAVVSVNLGADDGLDALDVSGILGDETGCFYRRVETGAQESVVWSEEAALAPLLAIAGRRIGGKLLSVSRLDA